MDPDAYLALLREDLAGMPAEQPPVDDEQEKTIARLWSVTLSTLQRDHPDAVLLLHVLAYCAPTALPRTVLDGALPTRQHAARALGMPAAYSLITLTVEEATVHRLLQAVLRADGDSASPSAADTDEPVTPSALAVALLNKAAPCEAPPDNAAGWPLWEQFLPHAEAEPMLRQTWQISRQIHGQRHPDTLTQLDGPAAVAPQRDRWTEVNQAWQRGRTGMGGRARGTPAVVWPPGRPAPTRTEEGTPMQTFLPFPDFVRTARTLDAQRLGKQRVETVQVLRGLCVPGYGWRHHPAVRMWAGYQEALVRYGLEICRVWYATGHSDTCAALLRADLHAATGTSRPRAQKTLAHEGELPPWLGNPEFHRSHQSALIRKDPHYYTRLFPGVPDDLPYVWPGSDRDG